MKSKRRHFNSGILIHIYQRTRDGFLLFYNLTDFLVYYTIASIVAPRYGVQILAMCQMYDHVHLGAKAERLRDLSAFMRDTSMWYSRYGQAPQMKRGNMFDDQHYGSALKKGDKNVRTNIIYIGNNPVERHLVNKAEEYRWNYLAYALSKHPFSEELIVRNASTAMKKAIEEVKATHNMDKPLSYIQIRRLFAKLDKKERMQLVDYIVNTYSLIDYAAASEYFNSVEDMVNCMHYISGSEYDIKETKVGRSDTCYSEITTWLIKNLHLKDIHDVFLMDDDKRTDLLFRINRELNIDIRQIAKYLRLKVESGH